MTAPPYKRVVQPESARTRGNLTVSFASCAAGGVLPGARAVGADPPVRSLHTAPNSEPTGDPWRDLQRDADVHVLHLLLHRVDAGERDRGQDRQGVAGDDLGRRAALGGDARLGDDPALALVDLGVDGRLQGRQPLPTRPTGSRCRRMNR